MKEYTTNLVSKQGGQWQVLQWDSDFQEWNQVGPYWDTEDEAKEAREKFLAVHARDNKWELSK